MCIILARRLPEGVDEITLSASIALGKGSRSSGRRARATARSGTVGSSSHPTRDQHAASRSTQPRSTRRSAMARAERYSSAMPARRRGLVLSMRAVSCAPAPCLASMRRSTWSTSSPVRMTASEPCCSATRAPEAGSCPSMRAAPFAGKQRWATPRPRSARAHASLASRPSCSWLGTRLDGSNGRTSNRGNAALADARPARAGAKRGTPAQIVPPLLTPRAPRRSRTARCVTAADLSYQYHD